MEATMTTLSRAAKMDTALTLTGKHRIAIKLAGKKLGKVEVAMDRKWTDESDGCRYEVQTEEHWDECDDRAEMRSAAADIVRCIRNDAVEKRAEADAEMARDAVEALIERGRVGDLLKALRSAKLI